MKKPIFQRGELESTYKAVESSESTFRFLEGAGHVSHGFINALIVLDRFLPPVKLILSGFLTIFMGAKYFRKFRKKEPTKIRIAGATINLGTAIASFALALTMLFVPILIPILTLVIFTLGVARELFNLTKTAIKQAKSKKELSQLEQQITSNDPHLSELERDELSKTYYDASLKHLGRQWKIAHHVADIAIGVLCVAAVAVVLTTGPIGWMVLGAVAIVGLSLKIGMTIARNYRIKKATKAITPEISEQSEVTETEKEGESKEEGHHPHRTSEIIEEMIEHPHGKKQSKPENLASEHTESLAKDESKLFSEAKSESPDVKPTPKATKKATQEDEDEEGEGEGVGKGQPPRH